VILVAVSPLTSTRFSPWALARLRRNGSRAVEQPIGSTPLTVEVANCRHCTVFDKASKRCSSPVNLVVPIGSCLLGSEHWRSTSSDDVIENVLGSRPLAKLARRL
jgi:hypothetical protein